MIVSDREDFEPSSIQLCRYDVGAVRETVERTVDVRSGIRDHRDAADLELGAGRVVRARFGATQVIADQRRRQSLVRDHAVFDRVAEIDETRAICSGARDDAALVRLIEDCLVADAHRADHQEAEVAHETIGKRFVGDVLAVDVEPESAAGKAAAVREIDLEIELDAFFAHGIYGISRSKRASRAVVSHASDARRAATV